ncbi:glycosyltransferase, partial [Clostridium perfringens]
TGYVIPPGNHELFATRTLELLQQPSTCQQFGQTARTYITQHFGMKVVADQYYRLFQLIQRTS